MRIALPTLSFLTVSLCFLSVVQAIPRIGIQTDYLLNNDNREDVQRIQSYSGVIELRDEDFHGWDPEFMKDGQLVNLAKIAYDEMVAIWRSKLLPIDDLPGAMVALATVDKIFFASSIKTGSSDDPPEFYLNNVIKEFLETCSNEGMGTHRNGGKCSEPNVLELHYSAMGRNPFGLHEGASVKARMAPWVRFPGAALGSETNYPPCGQHSGSGFGCHRILKYFQLNWAQGVQPDATGQDGWHINYPGNPRTACRA